MFTRAGYFLCTVAIAWLLGTPTMHGAETKARAEANKQLIQANFDRWRAGTGGPFELLAADATWTITGNSLVAKTYASRDEFLDTVIKPFNARLTKPLSLTIRSLHSEGDTPRGLNRRASGPPLSRGLGYTPHEGHLGWSNLSRALTSKPLPSGTRINRPG